MKACFMGLGYIGLPTAIIAAKHGIDIVGVDINPKVVEVTNQGKLHIIEPGMEEMLQEVIAAGKFKAYTNLNDVNYSLLILVRSIVDVCELKLSRHLLSDSEAEWQVE